MRKAVIATALVLTVVFVLSGFAVADPLKSGPQVGQDVPGPFRPLNVTGAKAGQKNCLYCQNGSNPPPSILMCWRSPFETIPTWRRTCA